MIQAECSKCGCIFDVAYDIRCPSCRAVDVERAFKPRNPQRTYDAIKRLHSLEMTNLDDTQVISKLWKDLTWEQAQSEGMSFEEYRWGKDIAGLIVEPDDPKYRIPKNEVAQIYELRRMRKLIGKL
jgi:uncharacterized Zn finger protein (UPF0148 family)